MSFLRVFFELEGNRIVLNFAHGLIFFLLGFSVLLKSKRWSELTLAKSLPFLALFGILNGMGDWGLVFLPIQTHVLSESVINFLWLLDTALLSLSYVMLLLFGLHVLAEKKPSLRWLYRATIFAYGLWLICYVWASLRGESSFRMSEDTHLYFEIAYRYAFAFIGSLVAAWALAMQRDELEHLGLKSSIRPLQWVGYSFVLHAIAAGLIVPEAPFFPANIINDQLLFEATAIPVRLFTGISGAIVAVFLLVSLEVFDAELARRLDEARQLYTVMRERTRIARDLHDGIIQTLYAVGLNLEGVSFSVRSAKEVNANEKDGIIGEIDDIMRSLDRAIRDVRRYIMQLKVPTTELSLDEHLYVFIREVQRETRVPVRVKADPIEPGLIPPESVMDILLLIREAVSNASRHAKATEIKVALVRDHKGISISVSDDGVGFLPEHVTDRVNDKHFGLENMERRAAALGGQLSIHSDLGFGTEILLRIVLGSEV